MRKLIYLCTVIALVFSNSEETVINNFEGKVLIISDQAQYQNTEQINISIKNNFNEDVNHFICHNVDLV